MEILRPGDAEAFLGLAGPLLERDEARNQLPLGIAGTLTTHPDAYEVVHFWVVRDAGEPIAAAVRTEPFNLVLGDPSSEAALVDRAADRLARASGRTPERILSEGVYGLTAVRDVARAPGRARAATAEDRVQIVTWVRAFATEAIPDPDEAFQRMERNLDTRFGGEGGGFWLWEDRGEAVSLSGFSGPTPTGIRIGPVYTPPEHRRHGYATTLVADLSAWLLEQGHRACFLYTDLANPTSNRIYVEIGYERVCDAMEFSFRTA
jgi:predicted GNAT family acetyltransferase